MFGAKPVASSSIFGMGGTAQQGTSGGVFGLGQNTQNQQQPQQSSSMFGNLNQSTQQKPSLFGGTTGGLFANQAAAQQGGGGFFGNASAQQQQQQGNGFGGSLFGPSQGAQSTPQSLTTSINDVSAYGTPSLFQGLTSGDVQNQARLLRPCPEAS